jgi:hypothetical protein
LVIICASVIVVILIGFLGYGGAGIVAGSLASIVQSICYRGYIAAGGLFSILQSVGALGLKVFLTRPGMIFLGISIAVRIIYNIIISIF